MTQNKDKGAELVCIVDDTGRLRYHVVADGAKVEAQIYLEQCKTGKVDIMKDATIVTGEDAKKALENGRI